MINKNNKESVSKRRNNMENEKCCCGEWNVKVKRGKFRKELESLINCHCQENGSNTPDFILAEYLMDCLKSFDKSVNCRTKWYENK